MCRSTNNAKEMVTDAHETSKKTLKNTIMEKLAAECKKPSDASDIGSKEDAVAEVQRLRHMFKDITSLQKPASSSKVNENPTKELSKADQQKCVSICEGKSSGDLNLLIDGDTNLNFVNEDDETMLHLACSNDSVCVEILVSMGAKLDLKDDSEKLQCV